MKRKNSGLPLIRVSDTIWFILSVFVIAVVYSANLIPHSGLCTNLNTVNDVYYGYPDAPVTRANNVSALIYIEDMLGDSITETDIITHTPMDMVLYDSFGLVGTIQFIYSGFSDTWYMRELDQARHECSLHTTDGRAILRLIEQVGN